jgi:hypothetical protein
MRFGPLRDMLVVFFAFMRFYEISVCAFMLFDPNEISVRDFMLISCIRFV